MPTVRVRGGWLKIGRRSRPGHPDQGLPGEPDYPDQGLPDEGDGGEYPDNELPTPPPGIWPPPTIGHPIVPVPPGEPGAPGHLPSPPPGSIWPPVTSPVEGLFVVLAHIPEHGWKYIVIDPDAWVPPAGGVGGTPPARPTPGQR